MLAIFVMARKYSNIQADLFRYKYSIVCGLLVGYASLTSHTAASEKLCFFENADKLVHLAMYFCLTLALVYELRHSLQQQGRAYAIACVVASVYGGLMEILQHYCCTVRTGDWWDWAADILGSVIAILVYTIFIRYKNKTTQQHDK